MKLKSFISLHAVLLIGFGIAFGLYAPLMMAFFNTPEFLEIDVLAYWQLTAFARMFGAALLGFGMLLFAIRGAIDQVTPDTRRGVIFSLFLANLISAIVSITQQSAIWGSVAGWIATSVFVVLTLGYGFYLIYKPKFQGAEP